MKTNLLKEREKKKHTTKYHLTTCRDRKIKQQNSITEYAYMYKNAIEWVICVWGEVHA